jgi:hypothetical protein
MLTGTLGALVKMVKIKNIIEKCVFNFLKIKKLLISMQSCFF